MSGALAHSPADIVRRLMISHNLGTDPDLSNSWPIAHNKERNSPDNTITVSLTTGVTHGRNHPDGTISEHYGIQVRVRSGTGNEGYLKSNSIDTELLESVYHEAVIIGSSTYCVRNITRSGSVNSLGNPPDSQRFIHTINYLVDLIQVV